VPALPARGCVSLERPAKHVLLAAYVGLPEEGVIVLNQVCGPLGALITLDSALRPRRGSNPPAPVATWPHAHCDN
jgi:hypothetical protein